MFNPLLPSTSDLKPSDLENKINELTKKYMIAARSGNASLAQQVFFVLEQYKADLQSRNLAASKAINTTNGNDDLGKLINID
jgi:hypothetical protein